MDKGNRSDCVSAGVSRNSSRSCGDIVKSDEFIFFLGEIVLDQSIRSGVRDFLPGKGNAGLAQFCYGHLAFFQFFRKGSDLDRLGCGSIFFCCCSSDRNRDLSFFQIADLP